MASRASLRYAETLVSAEDPVLAAMTAGITTKTEHFPGIVVLTRRCIMAVCGLPGIKRAVVLELERLNCRSETSSVFSYKATFRTQEDGFSLTVNPETGERFSRQLAVLRGEAEEFDAVVGMEKSRFLSPLLERNILRHRRTRQKENVRRKAARETLAAQFDEQLRETENEPKAVAARLEEEWKQK